VIQAVLQKIQARGLLTNVWDLQKYLDIVKSDVQTNLNVSEIASFAGIASHISPATDFVSANWSNTVGFLCDSKSSIGAYITLYGTPGNCGVLAGGAETSPAREEAISFVHNLLDAAQKQHSETSS
jgi:hypothetical protein